ncbi:MAG: DUF59 domain-containing protein [Planctomycetota bacterium]|nr:MAG: DUF59 domain-containing protein [Planctomycetota bacterium]
MAITKDAVLAALATVEDPAVRRDLVSIGAVTRCAVCDGRVSIALRAPGATSDEARSALAEAALAAVRAHAGESGAGLVGMRIEFLDKDGAVVGVADTAGPKRAPAATPPTPQAAAPGLPGVAHIVAVGAGKGGVGKSTIAVNLAVGLARAGRAVGLLDGDIYGPSLPTMMGLGAMDPVVIGNRIQPFMAHGVKCVTMGKLVEPGKPLIWRGPMAHGAFKQLAEQTEWGELDYLVIDLPPGTGDVVLTMAQMLRLDGAAIVCTPQRVAQDDAVRAAGMFRQLGVPVLGVVENMSYFVGDDGTEYDLFGRGGAEQMAQRLGAPYLGGVAINTRLRVNSDAGDPSANFAGDDALARDLTRLVERLEQEVALAASQTAAPTLTVR